MKALALLLAVVGFSVVAKEVKTEEQRPSVLCWVCCGNDAFDFGPVTDFKSCDRNGQICNAETGQKFYNSVAMDPIPPCPFAD